jgi:hypothetical protein
MGLLDFDMNDPKTAGLLNLGLGILMGNTGRPGDLGQGVMQGMGNYQNMMAQQQRQKMLEQQQQMQNTQFEWTKADREREQALREKRAGYLDSFSAGLPANLRTAVQAYPELGQELVKQQLQPDEIVWRNLGGKEVGVSKRTGRPVEGAELEMTMTPQQAFQAQWDQFKFKNPSASDLLQANTSRRGQDITLRGQNLTDARAKETNAIANETKALQAVKLKSEIQDTLSGEASGLDATQRSMASVQRLMNHPGMKSAVGFGFIPNYNAIPGTDQADFLAELDTFKSQMFLPMVQQLKGMGALSNAEGQKLTDAVGALNPKMSEKRFKESLSRIYSDLDRAAKKTQGGISRKQQMLGQQPNVVDFNDL